MKDRQSMTFFGTFAFLSAVAAFAEELEAAEAQESSGQLNSSPSQTFGYDPSVQQTVMPLNPGGIPAPDPVILNAAGKPETATQKKAREKKEAEQAKKEAAEAQAANELQAREQQAVMQNFNVAPTPNPMMQPANAQNVQQFEQQAIVQPQNLQYTTAGHQVPQQGQFQGNPAAGQQFAQPAQAPTQPLPGQGWVSPGAVAPPVTFDSMYQTLTRCLNNPQARIEVQQFLTQWGVTDINALYGQGEAIKSAYDAFSHIAQKFGA